MKMKFIALLFALMLIFLSGCVPPTPPDEESTGETPQTTEQPQSTQPPTTLPTPQQPTIPSAAPPETPQEVPEETPTEIRDYSAQLPNMEDLLAENPFDPVACAAFGVSKAQSKACVTNNDCTSLNGSNEWYCDGKSGCCETTDLTKLPEGLREDAVLVASTEAGKATLKMYGALAKPTSEEPSDFTLIVLGNSGVDYSIELSIPGTEMKKTFSGTIGKAKAEEYEIKISLSSTAQAAEGRSHGSVAGKISAAYLEAERTSDGRLEIPINDAPDIKVHRISSIQNDLFKDGVAATNENLKCFYDTGTKKGSRLSASITSQIFYNNGLNQEFKNSTESFSSTCAHVVQNKVDMDRMCSAALGEALTIAGSFECPSSCPIKSLYYDNDPITQLFKQSCGPLKTIGTQNGVHFFCMESVYVRCLPDFSQKSPDLSVSGNWDFLADVDVTIGTVKDTFTVNTGTGDVIRGGSCTEDWSCGNWNDWGSCSNSSQSRTRTCTDANNCGTTANKPATAESQSCGDVTPSCTESWSCGEYGAWGSWGACQESGTQTRERTRSCTDANNCGTTTSRPSLTESESQSCTYTPTTEKPEYSSHSSTLGSNISTMNYASDSKTFDLSATGGTYGYKILNIPPHVTVKICVSISSGTAPEFHSYPQYHYGYDWSDATWEAANPGCMTAYNKNDWANGILVHIGDPTPVTATGTITVTQQ